MGEVFDVMAIAIDIETNGLIDFTRDNPYPELISVAIVSGEGDEEFIYTRDSNSLAVLLETVQRKVSSEREAVVMHNALFDAAVLQHYGIAFDFSIVYDTLLMARMALPFLSSFSLASLATHVGMQKLEMPEDIQDEASLKEYNVTDARITLRLFYWLRGMLTGSHYRLRKSNNPADMLSLECRLTPTIIEMQRNGLLVDRQRLESRLRTVNTSLEKLYDFIIKQYNLYYVKEYKRKPSVTLPKNLNSPLVKAELLTKFGWIPAKFTGTNRPAVDKEVLEELARDKSIHPELSRVARLLFSLSKVSTLARSMKTYLDCIGKDGRIHSEFNQIGVPSGRMSSSHPNVQNVPAELRKFCVAPEGCYMVSGDFNAIEARVAAYFTYVATGDDTLVIPFVENIDLHTYNAEKLNIPRKDAKVWLYTFMYGGGQSTIAKRLGCTLEEAGQIMKQVRTKFAGLVGLRNRFLSEAKNRVMEGKPMLTRFGRPLIYPDLVSTDEKLRATADRNSFNALIQGTSADILKIKAIESVGVIRKYNAQLVNLVHDEVVCYVKKELAESFCKEMTAVFSDNNLIAPVPIVAEFRYGETWADVH